MSDLSLSILAETTNDAQAIERLHQRTFGPGRFVLSAYRIREHVDHLLDLSFTARIGTLLVGSVENRAKDARAYSIDFEFIGKDGTVLQKATATVATVAPGGTGAFKIDVPVGGVFGVRYAPLPLK